MKKSCYNFFKNYINNHILSKVLQKYSVYFEILKKEVEEDKANKKSWSGYDNTRIVGNFNKELNNDIDNSLNEILDLFSKIGRKLTKKQMNEILDMYVKTFDGVVTRWKNKLPEIIGEENATIDLLNNQTSYRVKDAIKERLYLMYYIKTYEYDKYFFWTVINTFLVIISIIINIIIDVI